MSKEIILLKNELNWVPDQFTDLFIHEVLDNYYNSFKEGELPTAMDITWDIVDPLLFQVMSYYQTDGESLSSIETQIQVHSGDELDTFYDQVKTDCFEEGFDDVVKVLTMLQLSYCHLTSDEPDVRHYATGVW